MILMLKKLTYITIACGLIYPAFAEEMSLEDTIAEVNDSVVSVVADTGDNQALGAGIIVSADGYVVTNAHVAENAENVAVVTTQDETYEAKTVGIDTKTDIALLKVENPQNFKPAQFADSDLVRTGNSVFAIGNPFGLGNSVSLGIISAKERDIEKGPYDNFLQTDTAINQGNSGGPLFNLDGEVVGMNTAIFSTDGNNMGVGFSTPANIVRWVVEELKENGNVVRGWLGIGVRKIRMQDGEQSRLVVAVMSEGSPAEAAGMKVGDVLLSVGDLDLSNPRLFSLQVSQLKPETKLPIKVLRDGQDIELEVVVKSMPQEQKTTKQDEDDAGLESSGQHEIGTMIEVLGMSVNYDEDKQEIIVEEIDEQSEAQKQGVSVGDRFKSINGHRILGMEDLLIKIKEAQQRGLVELQSIGEDGVNSVTLKLKDVP